MPDRSLIDFNAAVAAIVTRAGVYDGLAPAEMPDAPHLIGTIRTPLRERGRLKFRNDAGGGDACPCHACVRANVITFPGAPA